MWLRISHFCLVDLPFTPLSVRSLACKSPLCPCDPETIFWFNMFQPPWMLLQWISQDHWGHEFCLRVFELHLLKRVVDSYSYKNIFVIVCQSEGWLHSALETCWGCSVLVVRFVWLDCHWPSTEDGKKHLERSWAGAAATFVKGTNWWQLIFSDIICKLLFTGICSSPCDSEPWQDDPWNPCHQNICETIRVCLSGFRIASLDVFYQPFSIVCT